MIGKSYKRNGEAISHNTWFYQIGLTLVNWRKLDTTDAQQNLEWAHGIKMSPTYTRGRRIDIEGIIIADTREATSMAMDRLDKTFALQSVITDLPEKKPFSVVDEQGREWKIMCKIKDPIDYTIQEDDHMDGTTRSFRVSLQSDDARFFSTDEKIVEWWEGFFGGFKLWVKLSKKMDKYFNNIICIGEWNIATPAKIEIHAKSEIRWPIKIKQVEGRYFEINTNCATGDILIVDAEKKILTKNGVNIGGLRVPWSTWPLIQGLTSFAILAKNMAKFDAKIYFSNVLL